MPFWKLQVGNFESNEEWFLVSVELGGFLIGFRNSRGPVTPVLWRSWFFELNRLWAQFSLVVIIVLFHGREEDDVARAAVRSGVGWAGTAASVDRVVPVGATVVNMSDHGRFGGTRFAQLGDDYKV